MKKYFALILSLTLLSISLPALAAETANIPMLFYGEASWYGEAYHGRATASGESYDMTLLTAAHRTLPFGSLVRVTNLENDKSVTVRINDRGPFAKDRVIDLSRAAASLLDFQAKGTAKVEIRVVQLGDGLAKSETAHAAPLKEDQKSEIREVASESKPAAEPRQEELVSEAGKKSEPRIIRPEDVLFHNDVPERIEKAQTPAAQEGGFVIQAGAFLSLENAEGLLRVYQGMGLPVFIRQFSGELLHRVWVGPFAEKPAAELELERVRSRAEQAFIRKRD